MVQWCTYLELFIAKTYLGAFVLFVVGAPSLHLLKTGSVPTWMEYYVSFGKLFQLLAQADKDYM